jgi:hypothetical protein
MGGRYQRIALGARDPTILGAMGASPRHYLGGFLTGQILVVVDIF